jgi:hypothetical protein
MLTIVGSRGGCSGDGLSAEGWRNTTVASLGGCSGGCLLAEGWGSLVGVIISDVAMTAYEEVVWTEGVKRLG